MKKEYRSILWFAVFFTLPIVIFVAIYGMDYFLERTYYEIVAAGSLSIFFKMFFFMCVFWWTILIEVILWYFKKPLLNKLKIHEMPYYMFMAITATLFPFIRWDIFESIIGKYTWLLHAYLSLFISFALWLISKKARLKKSNSNNANKATSILPITIPLILTTGCTVILSFYATSFIFSNTGILCLLLVIFTELALWVFKSKVIHTLKISTASCHILMAAIASFVSGMILIYDRFDFLFCRMTYIVLFSVCFSLALMLFNYCARHATPISNPS